MSENKFVISEKVEKSITKDMIGLFFEDINNIIYITFI